METKEIFERFNITDGERHIGYASVRYPAIGDRRIDKYYGKLAAAFIKRAEKSKHTGMLNCRVTYEDEEYISVTTEARLYKENDCIRRHRSSFVWVRNNGRLCYIKKRGIRRSNLSYNGRELNIFD